MATTKLRSPAWPGLLAAALIVAAWLALHWGAIFALDPRVAPAWLVAAVVLLQAWLSTGLFILAHDAMHGSLAPGRPALNRWAGRAALMIYAGLDYDRMLPKHLDHHRHTGTDRDPDFDDRDPTRLVAWLMRFFRGYYTHAQLARITVVAIVYLLLGARLTDIALFWALPALLALVQLFVFGTWLPHRHVAGGAPFADRHRARSTRLPAWASLLTCFHFGGYHHEHHLHPHVPWWRLPATRASGRSV